MVLSSPKPSASSPDFLKPCRFVLFLLRGQNKLLKMPGNLIQAATLAFHSNALWALDVWLLGGTLYISTGHVAK